jgi:hypothetical protein
MPSLKDWCVAVVRSKHYKYAKCVGVGQENTRHVRVTPTCDYYLVCTVCFLFRPWRSYTAKVHMSDEKARPRIQVSCLFQWPENTLRAGCSAMDGIMYQLARKRRVFSHSPTTFWTLASQPLNRTLRPVKEWRAPFLVQDVFLPMPKTCDGCTFGTAELPAHASMRCWQTSSSMHCRCAFIVRVFCIDCNLSWPASILTASSGHFFSGSRSTCCIECCTHKLAAQCSRQVHTGWRKSAQPTQSVILM